jgi:uncharacterized membrane protein
MTAVAARTYQTSLHPLHAVLLGGMFSLFLAALLSDIAYASTFEIQWKNFASWLIAGGLVFGGFALLWALIGLFRADQRRGRPAIYFVLLLATWFLGLINALVHAMDAWAGMPTGLILSAVVAALAVAAAAFGFSARRVGEVT